MTTIKIKTRKRVKQPTNGTSPSLNGNGASQQKPPKPPTYPYEEKGDYIYHLITKKDKDGKEDDFRSIVCNFIARIDTEITGENGERYYRVNGWILNATHHKFTFDISTEDFSQVGKLRAAIERAAGAKVMIAARKDAYLAPMIKMFTSGFEQIKQYDRTGWAGDTFLIPGREKQGVEIDLPPNLPYSLTGQLDIVKGLKALEHFLESAKQEQTSILMTFSFQAPLAKLANWQDERYGLMIKGRTGNFKTESAKIAMCPYGANFASDSKLVKWGEGGTRNAIMRIASHAHDMPFLIDNYKPGTGEGEKGFVNLIHNMLEGGEKKRLNRASELKDARPVYCWPLITGEDAPEKDPATIARLLILKWEKNDSDKLSQAQDLITNLPAVGYHWLCWLESDEAKPIIEKEISHFKDKRKYWAEKIGSANNKAVNTWRIATNLATNEITFKILCQESFIGPIFKKLENKHSAGLLAIADSMAQASANSLEVEKFLSALRQVAAYIDNDGTIYTNISFVGDTLGLNPQKDKASYSNPIGFKENDEYFLMPDATFKAIYNLLGQNGLNNVSHKTIYEQLDEKELIKSKAKDGTTLIQKKRNGKNGKWLHLKLEALEEPDQS